MDEFRKKQIESDVLVQELLEKFAVVIDRGYKVKINKNGSKNTRDWKMEVTV